MQEAEDELHGRLEQLLVELPKAHTLGSPKCHPKKLHGQSASYSYFSTIESFNVLISSSLELRRKQYLGVGLEGPETGP
jgi:hypothetical protein